MRLKLSITAKLFILVICVVFSAAVAVSLTYAHESSQVLSDYVLHDLDQETDFYRYPLESRFQQIREDLMLLMGLKELRVASENDAEHNRIQLLLASFINTTSFYRRITIINAEDNEVLYSAGDSNSKAGIDAYTEILGQLPRLLRGHIYFSSLQLEQKEGKAAVPHVLLLNTYAMLPAERNLPATLIVIETDFSHVLSSIQQEFPAGDTIYVTNAAGDYLVHPDPAKLYASELGHDSRLQHDYTGLTAALEETGGEKAALLPHDKDNGNVLAYRKYAYDREQPDHFLGIAVESPYRRILEPVHTSLAKGFLLSLVIACAAVGAALLLLRHLLSPLKGIAERIVRYRKGEIVEDLPVTLADEIGVLAREFATMMQSKGEENWIKENLLRIHKALLGFKDLSSFSVAVIQALAPAVEAQFGALYLNDAIFPGLHSGGGDTLSLCGSYALSAADRAAMRFKLGDGLVGQCGQNRETILVKNAPADYLQIVSGLGHAAPSELLLMPLLFEDRLMGVVELGTLSSFTAPQMAFLEQFCFQVGVLLNAVSAGMQTQALLEESRATAEELQRNEEELKSQQEELESSNESLERKSRELEEQNQRIRNQSEELAESTRLIEEKAAELERTSKYKSEFLANMSHELRTPLNSLLILSRTLAANEEGNLTEEQIEDAKVIHSGGMELLSLINDILDLSKVEAGKIHIAMEPVPLSGIWKRLQQQFAPVAADKKLDFHVRCDEALPPMVQTDSQRVEQIVRNLLSNAFKFTPSGSVTLDIRQTQRGGDAAIAFSVRDTGIGIDKAKLQEIFEAFQQEDGSIGRHYGGTGLGLTIARKFAHLLGGDIQVQSAKGEGSEFALRLPLTVPAEDVVSGPAPQSEEAREAAPVTTVFLADDRGNIAERDKVLLIIEDDKAFASILLKMARKRGYAGIVAQDGKSGLLLAAQYRVTAILLDLKLPDLDGSQVLDQLKQNIRTRHIPVHIITGHREKKSTHYRKKGAAGYLIKPVSQGDMEGVFTRIEALVSDTAKKLLVVEDDRKTQAAIRALFKKSGISLTVCESGANAIGLLGRTSFDCVILDLRLPDMAGLQLLEHMETSLGNAAPPVIIYTASDITEDEHRMLHSYTGSIVIKGAKSEERLLDEVTLFLHSVESSLPSHQQELIRMQHDPDLVLKDRTVLLVDDDLRNTFALSRLLKKHGLRVAIADNGQMALETLREEKNVELVIMDIMMPIMDGYQAIRAIRADPRIAHLPVIAVTARAMPEEQEKCMEAGANDYLTKPVDADRLLTLLRVWLFKQEKAA